MFSVVIPNYNSEKYIKKCLDSILAQDFTDYDIIIVDDMSTDNSVEIIKSYSDPRIKLIELEQKAYNGGTRNIGVRNATGKYIIFVDCDDWFDNEIVLSNIYKSIRQYRFPDLIRLPYRAYYNGKRARINLHEKDLSELAMSVFVAPWTKCIKKEKFVNFPENTLLEDVVQHIAQIDNVETMGWCETPVVVWNRSNDNAISSDNAKYDKSSKRYSSVYRNMADLLDLRCKHDYCEEQRQFRISAYENIIQRGDILGLINGRNVE